MTAIDVHEPSANLVVVGVDGSEGAGAAVEWAAREASRRNAGPPGPDTSPVWPTSCRGSLIRTSSPSFNAGYGPS